MRPLQSILHYNNLTHRILVYMLLSIPKLFPKEISFFFNILVNFFPLDLNLINVIKKNNKNYLLTAIDQNKDQSYFLNALNQEQLANCLFPIGELTKPEVRKIAQQTGFSNYGKKDSTGICFIGERKFKTFLQNYLHNNP